MTPLTEPSPSRRTQVLVLVVLAGLVAVAGAFLLGQRSAPTGQLRDAVSIGFVRDMPVHHAQAVQMSAVLHRRSRDAEITLLAYDILTTQQGQVGIMTGWLDLAGRPAADGPVMSWMGHTGPMPGLASQQELASLQTLPVEQSEEQFLRLMIRHHRGALPMARHAAQNAEHPDLRLLAANMDRGQASEIETMQEMLVARGYEREPEAATPADDSHGGHAS